MQGQLQAVLTCGGKAEEVISLARAARRRADDLLTSGAANFWAHASEGALAIFGMQLTGDKIFPVLAATMEASASMFGALMSVRPVVGVLALILAPRVEAVQRKKLFVVATGAAMRLPVLLIIASLLLLAESAPLACLWAITAALVLQRAAMNIMSPAWSTLIAETVPTDQVVRLFGYREGISSLMGLAAGPVVAVVLAGTAFPANYVIVYALGFLALAVSWVLFSMVDEIPQDVVPRASAGHRHYFRELSGIIRSDATYRYYFAYQAISMLSMIVPFFVLVAKQHHGMDPAWVAGRFISASYGGHVVGSLLLARMMEGLHYKSILSVGRMVNVLACLVAIFAPSGRWFALVFFLSGVSGGTVTVVGTPFRLRVFPRDRRVGYESLTTAAMIPVAVAGPLASGFLLEHFGYAALFITAAFLKVAALVPLWRCRYADDALREAPPPLTD